MVSENQPEETPGAGQPGEGAPARATPEAATPPVPAPPTATAPVSKKDMTPEQRAAAIKAAQERALRMKAEREAARAAAASAEAGTELVPAAAAPPAGPAWRIPAAGAQQVAVARPEGRALADRTGEDRIIRTMVQRRQVLRGGVFATLMGFIILSVGSLLNLLNPRHIVGFGGTVKVAPNLVPKAGTDPIQIYAAKTWLVNLKPGEGGFQSVAASKDGGLIALYWKCVHLGCTVPWRSDFDFEGVKGWFRCPCHGSTYTKGGARVAGPAPRSLDTFDLTTNPDGSVTINTGKITPGNTEDPQRGKLPKA